MGALAAYLLLPQLGELQQSIRSLESVQPWWPAAGVGLMAIRYAMATLSLRAAVGRPLAFGPTLLVQVSSAFVGRLTPESIGWLVLSQRFRERSGLGRAPALAALALTVLAGGIVRLLLMVIVAVMVSTSGVLQIEAPLAWPYLPAIALGVGLIVLALRTVFRSAASRIAGQVESALRDLVGVFQRPARAATLFGAAAVVTTSYPLVLVMSVMAFGTEGTWLEVFAAYLGGTAVASVSPTPGNLGALEVALSAGLILVGVAPASAAASVLIYRLVTFWLPIAPGFLAFRYLQNGGHL
jgi:undecaprenyl-diphosphatase